MPKNVTEAKWVAQESLQLRPDRRAAVEGFSARWRQARFVTYGVVKRILDLVLAMALLVILSPIFLVVSIAVKIDSRGPILFKQVRVGKDGRMFEILKFRSMEVDNDINDATCKDKCTRLGRVLRKTSVDELPQLWNVLVGQMSFIGPRPWVPEYWENMNEVERERAKVRPGITGLAAAKGRNGLTVFEKIAYDLEYVQDYSLGEDVKVVALTVKMVLSGKEAEAGKGRVHHDIEDLKSGGEEKRKYFSYSDL